MNDQKILESIDEKLTAVVVMLAHSMELISKDSIKAEKIEVLLAEVGLSPTKIARLIGKKPDTVMKALKRKNKK